MFFNKGERQNTDMRAIKEAMESSIDEFPTAPHPQPAAEQSAPLFVKVDKYKEILITVNELKLFLSGVKQLFTVFNEIEAIRSDTLNILRANMQRMEKSLTEMDNNLLRPQGMSMHGLGITHTETNYMEDTLTELQRQLAELKRDIQGTK